VTDIPEVLFVCTHNAGRSQMAAALLRQQAAGRVRVTSAGSRPADELNPAVVRAMTPVQSAKVHIVNPGSFNDAKEIGDRLKDNQPVIINLQDVERDLRYRIVDFCGGAAYVLGAHLEKAADKVLLLTPTNVEVSADESAYDRAIARLSTPRNSSPSSETRCELRSPAARRAPGVAPRAGPRSR